MGWARFDDGYAFHPKLVAAGLEARGLDAAGICYCQAQSTDGFVPDAVVTMLAGAAAKGKKVAQGLLDVGRWTRDDDAGGYWIHDYLAYNESRAQVDKRREAERERKAAGRSKQGRDPTTGRIQSAQRPGGQPPESGGIPNGNRPDGARNPEGVPPVPTRPDRNTPLTPPPTSADQPPDPASATATHTDQPTDPLVTRLTTEVAGWTGRTRPATDVITWATAHLDRRFIDGCIGLAASQNTPPRTPSLLKDLIRREAVQAGGWLPEWDKT
jgi:hypothetical protein